MARIVSISPRQIVTSCCHNIIISSSIIIIIISRYNNNYYAMIALPFKNGNSVTVYTITEETRVIWDRKLIPLLIKLDIAYYHIYTVKF